MPLGATARRLERGADTAQVGSQPDSPRLVVDWRGTEVYAPSCWGKVGMPGRLEHTRVLRRR